MIFTSITRALIASFAMFPTVFKTYEKRYISFRSKELPKRIFYSEICSLRSKRSRTKRTKFGPRKGVIRAARKIGREQKGRRKGVGERKEGNACPQTPRF